MGDPTGIDAATGDAKQLSPHSPPCIAPRLTGIETVADLAAVSTAARMDGDGRPRDTADPEDVRHDNLRRAGLGARALVAYADTPADPPGQVMADLFGDLRHLADALGLDYGALDDEGWDRYNEERHGQV